jgi:TRAP-type C4-dicarboxylate transport system permease small subunit
VSASPTTAGGLFGTLDACLRPLELIAAIIAGVMMLAAMVLTSFDALLRYGFDAPLTFNYYLTENYLMIGMLTMPLAWGFRSGGYIRVLGLTQLVRPALRDMMLRAGLVLSSAYVAALAWFAGVRFLENYRRGAVDMGIIDWPLSWSWIWVPVGLTLLALRLLATAIGPGHDLHANQDDVVEDAV